MPLLSQTTERIRAAFRFSGWYANVISREQFSNWNEERFDRGNEWARALIDLYLLNPIHVYFKITSLDSFITYIWQIYFVFFGKIRRGLTRISFRCENLNNVEKYDHNHAFMYLWKIWIYKNLHERVWWRKKKSI